MRQGLRVSVLFCETEVYHVHTVLIPVFSYQEIIWLDVSMQNMHGMEVLHSRDHLFPDHANGFDA